MPLFTLTAINLGSVSGIASLSYLYAGDNHSHHHSSSSVSALTNPCFSFPNSCRSSHRRRNPLHIAKVSVSGNAKAQGVDEAGATVGVNGDSSALAENLREARWSADWEEAKAYRKKGLIHEGRIEGLNGGGLLVRFHSLVGFLPYPQLSPYHSCEEPKKSIQDIAESLRGSRISVKVIKADEANRTLIFSEKEAMWSKYSQEINMGDIFQGRVGSVEGYGAFVHLRFPDGSYHITGLVHVSEVSWDLVQDVRDILSEGDEVRVKVIKIDRVKSKVALSIKQLEEDPLLETLDKVIPKDGSVDLASSGTSRTYNIEPLPGLESILEELVQEKGISDVRITRQGFEKRVVSPDLQLWLSNAPAIDEKFTLLARAGRQVQEIQLRTVLDQEGIKRALQRVLERVP